MITGNTTKRPCCKCNKGGATFTCDGCHQSFYLNHASDHRKELSQQMDNIGQQHDNIKRDIDEQNINKTLLEQVDQWEEESITKIRSTARKARSDLKRLTEESKTRLSGSMSKLSNELRSNRENDDYAEEDLDRWMNQAEKLRKELEKSSEVDIVEDKSSSFYLIKIKKINADGNDIIDWYPQNVTHPAEKFSEIRGLVVLSKNGCSATCTSTIGVAGDPSKYSSACGRRLYSFGIHNLRFRLNTSRYSSVFFGILQASQPIVDESAALNTAYGWRSDGGVVKKGVESQIYGRIQTQPNDEVLLILDYSLRKISYGHERTQMHYEMKVEQKTCPLPWKLLVTLWHPNDKIEILN